ncbi:hypothetical protein OUZ56_005148 [Daphnia magna]|uniref:Uncharacterized protein n=1 Tax=Daphnia magna TaxID=35525 RepID=A0ABQ9YRZ1_9CRUS|nr:hypothetical protein OUZ56_005148 [Daphnia magna]
MAEYGRAKRKKRRVGHYGISNGIEASRFSLMSKESTKRKRDEQDSTSPAIARQTWPFLLEYLESDGVDVTTENTHVELRVRDVNP